MSSHSCGKNKSDKKEQNKSDSKSDKKEKNKSDLKSDKKKCTKNEKEIKEENKKWFDTANLGIFLHWGLYSVPAFDSVKSARRRKTQNGSEWYYDRLKKKYREGPADTLTKKYHKENYGEDFDYFDFEKLFTGKNFKPEEWCKTFSNSGVKYIVLTARHHDGFCLWDTKTTEHNVMNTPLNRDIVKELRLAAKKNNLKFGIYYSWMEFGKGLNYKYVQNIVIPQLEELKKYEPDLWWMDGDWACKSTKTRTCEEILGIKEFLKSIHSQGAIINNRLGNKDKKVIGDYDNVKDRFISEEYVRSRYESCQTIGLSWGYNSQQEKKDYKTPKELSDIYKRVTQTNGNLLLNIAIDKDGNFDDKEMKIFLKFSKLIC